MHFSLTVLFLAFSFLTSSDVNDSTQPESLTAEKTTFLSSNAATSRVYFRDLRRYPLNNRPVPEELKELNGSQISIVGYMVPFDRIENITQFILLQAPFMGCLHVPPPQANETIMVNTAKPLRNYTFDPLRITGELVIEEVFIDGFLVSVFTIEATDIRESTADDAELDDLPPNFHMYGDF